MELQELSDILQGNIPTRIEVATGTTIETITMQELNYIANVSDELPIEKFITVQSDKVDTFTLTKENDIVVSLSSGKAIVIGNERTNKLILSNLAIIRIKDTNKLDPNYLCWFINNNKYAIKQLNKLKQANAAVSVIPISMLKIFNVDLLPIEKQQIIGKINELKRHRDRIAHSIETKKTEILTHELMRIYEKELNYGKKRI